MNLNIAQKFKIYLTTAKKDDTIAGNVVKEFENLVKQIINIKKTPRRNSKVPTLLNKQTILNL